MTGFTASFTLEAGFLVVAVIAGLFIPAAARARQTAAAEPTAPGGEFVRAQEAG